MPISYDEFRYDLHDEVRIDGKTGEVIGYMSQFCDEHGSTYVEVFIDHLNDHWWTWRAWRKCGTLNEIELDHPDCYKDTAGMAAYDAYWELLKAHWI